MATDDNDTGDNADEGGSRERRPVRKQGSRPRRLSPARVAAAAKEQLSGLTGRAPESVTSLDRDDDGWKVNVEVVEVRRIPDSADILALYEVQIDGAGELSSYRRVRRYARGRSGEE